MRFRMLGKTGLRVSVVGLGTFQFGGSWGKTFSKKEAAEIIGTAGDCGINILDTAECYGVDHLAEKLVGHAIASTRSRWLIATKFGHVRLEPRRNSQAWDPASVQKQLEASLRALQTDYIDLYQFHSGSNEDFDNDELWAMLDKQKQAGKIRQLGISVSRKSSEWREYQTRKASSVGVSAIQVKYNRVERDAETEVLPECLTQDLGVLVR
ncbi:aldo/keto reductase, partial [Candidatus Bipolaricaulota bacterium]|nr:aldo/keto reductase [Candidatus Bipolaricaulota bacterium]